MAGDGNLLHDFLTLTLERTSTEMRERLVNSMAGASFFGVLAGELDAFERRVGDVRGALAYLDRLYIAENTPGGSIK